jgi:hypothetical protein
MFHPIAFSLKHEEMSMVCKTVDHRGCHLFIREDAAPLGEFKVGRQDQTFAFITVGDDLKQKFRTIPVESSPNLCVNCS